MQKRPALTKSLSDTTFRDFYWLKAELQDFCSKHGLGTVGTKAELADRVAHYLRTGQPSAKHSHRQKYKQMPATFSLESVITPGWRCTSALREFLIEHIGPSFRFNKVMRQFIHERPGCTLADAIAAYLNEKRNRPTANIGPQFEYNRFTREYWLKNPDATRNEVVAAWYEFRNTAKSKR